jgi:hypothetical protein
MDDLEYYPFTDPEIATYAIDSLRSFGWLEKGEALLEVAAILAPELEHRWRDRFPTIGEPGGPDFRLLHGIFLMHCGLAAENFCKALVAVRLPEEKRNRVRQGERLPRSLTTHDLHSLCKQIGFSVLPADDELVKRLEIAVRWFGRYPVPLTPAELRPRTAGGRELWVHALGSEEVRKSIDLVQRINSFVRTGLRPRAAGL